MRPFTLKVITQNSEEVKALQDRCSALQAEVMSLKRDYHQMEYKYVCECQLNMECIDLLRAHGIPFRKHLDRRNRR